MTQRTKNYWDPKSLGCKVTETKNVLEARDEKFVTKKDSNLVKPQNLLDPMSLGHKI